MNTQQLLSFLHTPENLGKDAGALLDRLTREFPYFQTAQLLYVKSLHNDNSFLYNNQLKLAAAYATDRNVLYELIRKKASEKTVEPVVTETKTVEPATPETHSSLSEKANAAAELIRENTVEPEKQPAETDSVSVQLTASQLIKARLNNTSGEWDESVLRQLQLLRLWQKDPTSGSSFVFPQKEQPKTEEQTPVVSKTEEPVAELQQPVPEVVPETIPEIKTEPESDNNRMEKDRMQELLTVLIDSDSEDVTTDENEIQLLSQLPDEQEEDTDYEIVALESEPVTEEVAEVPEKHIEKPTDPVEQEILFKAIGSSIELEVSDEMPSAQELLAVPAKTETTEPKPEEKTTTAFVASDEALSFAGWLKQLGKPQPSPEPTEQEEETPSEDLHKEQNKLIDSFIEASPRITPQKAAFYNPANMAKKSVTEDNELISETLAQIYEKQGNIPKAIRAYQRLSLKYPEKSIYFASLIEKLKSTPNKNTK